MGVRTPSAAATTTTATQASGNAEGIIVTLPPISGPLAECLILLIWEAIYSASSTGQTGVIFRLRRGTTITGTIIGNPQTLPIAAATTGLFSGSFADSPGIAANQQYVLTAQAVAGTGTNPGWSEGSLIGFVL